MSYTNFHLMAMHFKSELVLFYVAIYKKCYYLKIHLSNSLDYCIINIKYANSKLNNKLRF